ncbi:MAG: GAF domain-containing sensor histidine kinase [Salinivirgaceae bacterium]|jgi:signal transduction histidine kinase|nr:GAF domain-containing sensor histidine kinase [Salinivirgaceae bacterium]
MKIPDIPINEVDRLNSLKEYSILDTLPEKEYDDITFLASQICQTPISLVSLIDEKRQWFKSHHGLNSDSTSREVAFCAHAINDMDNILVVPDSRKDKRFFDNPLVTDHPNVVFYVGIPLVNPEGFPLGTLCVIDNKPNELNEQQIKALKALSNQLLKLFELRKNSIVLHKSNFELQTQNKGLNDFVKVAAHDIKSPMGNIIQIVDLIMSNYTDPMHPKAKEFLGYIRTSTNKLWNMVDGILQYSRDTRSITNNREEINLKAIINDIFPLVDSQQKVDFRLNISDELSLFSNKTALHQIFVNLITNSIKYNDKHQAVIEIEAYTENNFVKIILKDNGPGISPKDAERIFNLFEITANKDKEGFYGTGIGLATVKSLIESLDGYIKVVSDFSGGACFEFTLKLD